MRIKHGIILIALGIILVLFGALFKLQHWPGANWLLTIGIFMEAAGVLVLVIRMLRNPGNKAFLNS